MDTTSSASTEAKIQVSTTLRGAHRFARRAHRQLQSAKMDVNRYTDVSENAPLEIRVSKPRVRRAVLLMDALLKALELRGFDVESGPVVTIENTLVSFRIVELLDSTNEPAEGHRRPVEYDYGSSQFIKTKKVPSGRLMIETRDCWGYGCHTSWKDTKKKRLEDRLHQVVAGLVRLVAHKKEREGEERRKKEAAAHLAEKRRLAAAEQSRVDGLKLEAACWAESETLRRYIEANRQHHLAEHGNIESGSEIAKWVEWASEQADRLDPLRESPHSILDGLISDDPPNSS